MIRLFKYRPFNDFLKPILVSQKIWFPKRATLNDAEDLLLVLLNDVTEGSYREFLSKKDARESWSRERRRLVQKKSFTSKGSLSREARRKIVNSQSVLQNYLDELGVLSLTEKEEDLRLWKEYGDEERGVCLMFDMQPSEHLLKVEYKTQRPELKLSDLLLSSDAEGEIRRVLRTKTWRFQ